MIHKHNQLKTQRIEGIGIGSLYFGAAVSGQEIAIGIHVVIALGTYVYDKLKEKENLIENMNDFKKNLGIKFEGIKDKIETVILKMKKDTQEEIEKFDDS